MGSSSSKPKVISLPEDVLEQLRCCVCRSHLSCGPVRLLSDGSSICGNCHLAVSNQGPVYRQLTLEAVLTRVKFPCRFRQYGCQKKRHFGRAVDHEEKCAFRPFSCPTLPLTSCSWHGSMIQVREHFNAQHPQLVIHLAQFRFNVERDKEETLLVVGEKCSFIVKYRFEAATLGLQYIIRFLSHNAATANYEIRLVNTLNPNNSINLKGNRCLPYITDSKIDSAPLVAISKYLDVLESATNLTVELNLPRIKSHKVKVYEFVNYELLETIRCIECESYLALPIFDGPRGIVCADCSMNCVPNKNQDLEKLLAVTNYPCRWNHCKFIGKGHLIRSHEQTCPNQPQNCPAADCKHTLVVSERNSMEFHLLLHGFQYFCKRNVYTSSFQLNDSRTIVTTTKDNYIIAVIHKVSRSTSGALHNFNLKLCNTRTDRFMVTIYFEHTHCKLKSRRFSLDNTAELRITKDMLPKCYRDSKKMTVIVEV